MTAARPEIPDTFTVDVERLTYGPDALAHYEGCVVFVPFAAPGDRADVAVEERHAGYVRARATHLLAPGPTRVPPFCSVFGRCGGCQWQHVSIDAQRDAKRAIVAEQLARLGGLRDVEVRPTLAAGSPGAYRGRITLAVQARRLGYFAARSHELVEITGCPIAATPVTAFVAVAAAWVADGAPALVTLTIAAAPRGVVVVADTVTPVTDAEREAAKAWRQRTPVVQGLVLRCGRQRLVLGDAAIHVPLEDDLHLEVPVDVFAQVNPAANPLLVATVLEATAPGPGATVLDLYCGAGNFALPLARRGTTVHAIESSKLAVVAGRANAVRMRIDGVRFECGDVATALPRVARGHLDAAILDPPRRGAAAAIAPLVRHRPERIVYVSCDAATLARDARTLAAHHYQLTDVQPLDLFPHTHHVEIVARFQLT
jgi:23S rRNA (uracil1939-C5)-methyltransferase